MAKLDLTWPDDGVSGGLRPGPKGHRGPHSNGQNLVGTTGFQASQALPAAGAATYCLPAACFPHDRPSKKLQTEINAAGSGAHTSHLPSCCQSSALFPVKLVQTLS